MYQTYFRRIERWSRYLWIYLRSLAESNEIKRRTDFARIQNPVLLLYGFGATRRSLTILEERLRQEGFDVFTLRLGGFLDTFNTGSIDSLSRMVAERVESLFQRYPLPKMAIIGVSKGGLIGRYYISALQGDRHVHTLITLATPHQGNPWMFLFFPVLIGFFSKGIRQMVPGSAFLKKMAETPLPADVQCSSLFSASDKVCQPVYCQMPEQPNVRNLEIEGIRHTEFVIKRKAFEVILKELRHQ